MAITAQLEDSETHWYEADCVFDRLVERYGVEDLRGSERQDWSPEKQTFATDLLQTTCGFTDDELTTAELSQAEQFRWDEPGVKAARVECLKDWLVAEYGPSVIDNHAIMPLSQWDPVLGILATICSAESVTDV